MPTPTFSEKEYQQRALERFDAYLSALEPARAGYEELEEIKRSKPKLPLELVDFASQAWRALADQGLVGRPKPYSPRQSGDKQPVPNCTYKIPTGGGKTYLAAASVSRLVTAYLRPGEPRFVLWVVPSEAIYAQTKRQLSDREHPYRQLLDRASGGRVRILEKESPLAAEDIVANLCVMLLMLPAANRETKETLRMFRDRGNVTGFFPKDDDQPAHAELVKQIPNLDFIRQSDFLSDDSVGIVRSSLGNVLRLLRPLVVMDEGQKAFSHLAYKTLYDFNPRFVLELSATPKDADQRWSNWLTDIRGTDLEAEEMIKMPIILDARETADWRDCLRRAWEKTQDLQILADRFRQETPRYIRPILLVQVERTGKREEGANEVHALDAKEFLISLGLSPDAVKLKTADVNEIANEDLLSPASTVRAIITKSALQEGWDCPFAYVLCSLTPARSLGGMTQILGRILRQPEASKTKVNALDQCYVFTSFAQTREVFAAIKKGLEEEGMGDLAGHVKLGDGEAPMTGTVVRERRADFRGFEYYLPQVLYFEGGSKYRRLDWETDILGAVAWEKVDIRGAARSLPKNLQSSWGSVVEIGLGILTGDGKRVMESGVVRPDRFDLTYAVRALAADVPNPFIAARMIQEFLAVLSSEGWSNEDLALQQRYLLDQILRFSKDEIEAACRAVFEKGLIEHRILFNLRTTSGAWSVPSDSPVVASRSILPRDDGLPFQGNLFDPVYDHELNGFEYKVASYVDRNAAVDWWYRNVARGDGYGLQGWKKNRMYPDFILARRRDPTQEWVVLETKGGHLADNPDTTYKKQLVERLVQAYSDQRDMSAVGELEIWDGDEKFDCKLLMQTGWEAAISAALG